MALSSLPAAPPYAPVASALAARSGLSLAAVRCTAGPGDRPYEERHSAACVALVRSGTFTYRAAGDHCILSPGWILLGNPAQSYVCSHEHGQGRGDRCLALNISEEPLDLIRSAAGVGGRSRPFARACLPPLPRIGALMSVLRDCSGGDREVDLAEAAFAALEAVLHALADGRSQAARPVRPGAAERERIHEAVRTIEEHAKEPLLLEDIAAAVDLSPFHFLRVFQREIGVTPRQYLIRARLFRAMDLLRDTALPVTEVAFEAGYQDLSNFVRTFHREVGCSPRDFRRRPRALAGSKILQERGR